MYNRLNNPDFLYFGFSLFFPFSKCLLIIEIFLVFLDSQKKIKFMSLVKLSKLAETLKSSEIVKLGNAISERVRNGEKIYNYTIGDFDPAVFPIPQELENEIIRSYKEKNTNYPPAAGVKELRTSVSGFIKRLTGMDYAENEILIAAGGRPLIYTIFRAVVDPGDKVVYAVPSWNNNHYGNLTQAEHCLINCLPENNFMPCAADIEPHLKGAALLCLCTPQNPTGTTLAHKELEKICDLVLAENASRGDDEKKLYVMFDQMYWTLTHSGVKHETPVTINPAMKAYTLFVDGISKAFSATGVRVGWSLGPAAVIAKMGAILSHVGGWAPMAEQKAVARFLNNEPAVTAFSKQFNQALHDRLSALYEGFMDLKRAGFPVEAIIPEAAIYLTVKVDLKGKHPEGQPVFANQQQISQYLLDEAKLAIVPFSSFGAASENPWYRISVGTCRLEEIPEMFAKFRAALEKLH